MSSNEPPGRGTGSGTGKRALGFSVLTYLLAIAYAAFFGWLSVVRHLTFESNAMDLGYTDQAVWNTLHGRLMRFSTYQGAPIDLPLDQFRRTDTLLAYHVEPILVPISLLYLLYDSPIALLVLQTVGIAAGALPAFWLARDQLRSGFAGFAFATLYLLAPAIEGANLSDFHAVSLSASLLLSALYFLHLDRRRSFLICVLVALSTREDVSLLVVMLGLYVAIVRGKRALGATVAALGLAWLVVCTQLILPYYSGLRVSPFAQRMMVFGSTLAESARNVARDPLLVWRWLRQPQIVTYLGGLLATGGFASLLSPLILVLSAPIVAMNVFSNWSWTHSEGAHYSASIVPFVIVSAIYGLGALARWLSRRVPVARERAVTALAALALAVGLYHHYQIGISPLARSYRAPRFTAHHRLGRAILARIPPSASVSTQSGLYPHLAHREEAYFFPAVNGAQYVLVDVTASPYPITIVEVHDKVWELLRSGDYVVSWAEDGYLLLERGPRGDPVTSLPEAFYRFAHGEPGEIAHPLEARFGEAMELVGYDYTTRNVVHASQLPASVATYWRVLDPPDTRHRPVLLFSRQDGAIVYHYDGPTAATVWYPVPEWREGELVRVETPTLGVGRLRAALVAVVPAGGDPWSPSGRLQVRAAAEEADLPSFDGGTLLQLFEFP